ncbi:MAG: histone deacetylase [Gemmatimonadota bacterium]|nr:histone deacetylase [Gemmatimonadota bacterium]
MHHEAYEVDIGPHVFPTAKYRLVLERLRADGRLGGISMHEPGPASDDDILLVHTADWVRKFSSGHLTYSERVALEVPWSAALVHASWLCAGGSILTGQLALENGLAVHLGGGFHHAFSDHGEGFCAINDVAVAIRVLQRDRAIERAIVVDLDVHHGNGTAAIFADDPSVFTMSFHQERNYPAVKPPGDLDIGLENGTGDEEYLRLLAEHLPLILDDHRPDVAFYLAGADPYREDQLGGLGLTLAGLRERDVEVLRAASSRQIPTAVCLAGGYAYRQSDTVSIHAATVEAAMEALSDCAAHLKAST